MGKRLELAGQKFGRLTVIKFAYINNWKNRCWLCECDCGNYTTVRAADLSQGKTKSCGCLQKEFRLLPEGEAACKALIRIHKRMAKIRNHEWALSDEQVITLYKENCHYCGSPPSNIHSPKSCNGSYTYNGIDRVDNTKGYTLDNVVSCCGNCNSAKGAKTEDEFLDHIKQIYLHRCQNS